jgi:hypothetical protein
MVEINIVIVKGVEDSDCDGESGGSGGSEELSFRRFGLWNVGADVAATDPCQEAQSGELR